MTATIDHAIETLGGVDVLVNCAGWTVDRLFMEKPREEWEREIAIDMWGFINATRAVLDHMIERGSGRIVSIGSDAGRIGEWREAVYSGTKAGVIAMSKAIAKEVGKHGITLNVVCPGFTPGDPGGERRALDLAGRAGRAVRRRDPQEGRALLSAAPPRHARGHRRAGAAARLRPRVRTSPARPCR